MARPVVRIGDSNTGGGIVTATPQGTVFADGLPVAVTGARGTGHGLGIHSQFAWVTIGNSKVLIDGIPVVGMGDMDSCTHVRINGSAKVFIS